MATYFVVTYDFDEGHKDKRDKLQKLLTKKQGIPLSESAYLLRFDGNPTAVSVWDILVQEMTPPLDGAEFVEDGDQVWAIPTIGQMKIAGNSKRKDADDIKDRLKTWGVLSLAGQIQ